MDGVSGQDGAVWARVAVPFAGNNRGAFLMPDVGDEVLVIHLGGDPRFPVVIGGLWNGHDSAPDSFGGSGDSVDRWTFTGKAGTKISIVEDSSGPTIQFTTPGGLSGKMTDSDGSIEFQDSVPDLGQNRYQRRDGQCAHRPGADHRGDQHERERPATHGQCRHVELQRHRPVSDVTGQHGRGGYLYAGSG